MLKYYITIVVRANNLVHHLVRNEENIDTTIQKELGSWGNLHGAMTSGKNTHPREFFQTGVTKDNTKAFSILAIWEEVTIDKEVVDNLPCENGITISDSELASFESSLENTES